MYTFSTKNCKKYLHIIFFTETIKFINFAIKNVRPYTDTQHGNMRIQYVK